MSRGRLVVHAHFYQPSRIDPFSGGLPPDTSAAPARDWNTRISEECYRPNAAAGNLRHCSWDLGPTLAAWMERGDPIAYRGFVAGDRGRNGLAQPYHHTILPFSFARPARCGSDGAVTRATRQTIRTQPTACAPGLGTDRRS